MRQSSCFGLGLSQTQANIFKLNVSAACRRMTAAQILELADHLHAIIRKRSSGAGSRETAMLEPPATANDADQRVRP